MAEHGACRAVLRVCVLGAPRSYLRCMVCVGDCTACAQCRARRQGANHSTLATDRVLLDAIYMRSSPLVALVILAACGGATTEESSSPRGPRASDHMAMAHRETKRSDELARWPETRTAAEAGPQFSVARWSGRWDTEEDHRRMAQVHRGEAAQLEVAYQDACGTASANEVMVSPLRRYGVWTGSSEGGSIAVLGPDAGPPEKLLAALRCHRAWMMLGRSAMDDCPLDLPGLHVAARGDAAGTELTFTIDDATLVPELRRRVARDVEAKQPPRHQP